MPIRFGQSMNAQAGISVNPKGSTICVASERWKQYSPISVTVSGIIGVMFDRDSLGVANVDRRVTTNYNPKAEFFNNWFKFDAGYFNDFNENFIVFYVAD